MYFNFAPSIAGTTKVTANGTPTTVSGTLAVVPGDQIRVLNAGTVLVFVRVGASTALATDVPVLPASAEVFDRGSATVVAVLSSVATAADVYFTIGTGT